MNSHRWGNLLISAAVGLAVAGSLLFASVPNAYAAFILSIDDEGDCQVGGQDCDVYIVDDGDGIINYFGIIDNWTLTLTTGLSKPAIGDNDTMQFNSVDLSSSKNGGSIYLSLTDTDFTSYEEVTNWITTIFGSTSGTFGLEVFVNEDNLEFSTTGTQVADLQYDVGSFDETVIQQAMLDPDSPFSVTILATITHGGGWQGTFFNANVTDPPALSVSEPGTLSLFGIGLFGFGLLFRRRVRSRNPGPVARPGDTV